MSWLERLVSGWGLDTEPRPAVGDPALVAEVMTVLDEMRPMFKSDGGDVRLIAVEDGWVTVQLRGACASCASSEQSLFGALEPRLRERCTWVRGLRTR